MAIGMIGMSRSQVSRGCSRRSSPGQGVPGTAAGGQRHRRIPLGLPLESAPQGEQKRQHSQSTPSYPRAWKSRGRPHRMSGRFGRLSVHALPVVGPAAESGVLSRPERAYPSIRCCAQSALYPQDGALYPHDDFDISNSAGRTKSVRDSGLVIKRNTVSSDNGPAPWHQPVCGQPYCQMKSLTK
jgi:hypothetical protein